MSQANVETVRRVYKLTEAEGVEGLLELATDDIVWISDRRFPGGGRRIGKENVQRWLRELWIYDEVSIDIEEIIDLDDRALGITQFHGVSAGAPPVTWRWCHLFTFSDGLISQAQSFLDRSEALQAAGLWQAMSEESVGIVRRAWEIEAVGRDHRDKALAVYDPNVVAKPLEERPAYGLDAYLDYLERWFGAWEELDQAAEEYIGAGDRVIVTGYFRGRGRGSGAEVDSRIYVLYTLRGGKIVAVDEFAERDEALEVAGLRG